MKILVTGGAGYIGSIVSERLLDAGHEVVVYDNLAAGHISAIPAGAAFVEGDLAEPAEIRAAFTRHPPDAVMHFAGHRDVGESWRRPFDYLGRDVLCAVNLLHVMVESRVNHFILSSTANLFADPMQSLIDEGALIDPGSPYGESKRYLERMLHWLDQTHGLKHASLRYFNAAGATEERGEDHDPETHLIPLVLSVAEGRRPHLVLFGGDYDTPDGTCIRDFVHVSDLAEAHLLALEAIEEGSRTFHLGNGTGFSVREVIECARRVTGRNIPITLGPRRPGDAARLVADSSRVRRELGWAPRFPRLEEIIESAWRWMRRFPQGYGPRGAPPVSGIQVNGKVVI
jgi:UDP-glucose 4-epimerase